MTYSEMRHLSNPQMKMFIYKLLKHFSTLKPYIWTKDYKKFLSRLYRSKVFSYYFLPPASTDRCIIHLILDDCLGKNEKSYALTVYIDKTYIFMENDREKIEFLKYIDKSDKTRYIEIMLR